MDPNGFGKDRADLLTWIQSRVRVLEDHLQRPTMRAKLTAGGGQIDPVERDFTTRRLLHTNEQTPEGRLPASALANDAQCLSAAYRERDSVDCVQARALATQEPLGESGLELVELAQLLCREQWLGFADHDEPRWTRESLAP